MNKKLALISFLAVLFTVPLIMPSLTVRAEEEDEKYIEGTLEKIAADGSYIIVDGQKILTTKEYIEQEELTKGDEVIIDVTKTKNGWKAIEYEPYNNEESDNEIFSTEQELIDDESNTEIDTEEENSYEEYDGED